ncbi:MAG: polysaccharide pyruvyl transferase family protein [Clostridiaceae bacterium]|nr:polysaccharide pyruvyl transferase family protein [Clostridiaceae bacterium]
MKLGILTFQFAHNYGALLQAYSLKKYLEEKLNSHVEIINYANRRLKNAYSLVPVKSVKSIMKVPIKILQYNKFVKFLKDYIEIEGAFFQKIDFDKYDIVIVGSDQVWNTNITFNDYTYFINNDNSKLKKVSYAASIGTEGFEQSNVRDIVEMLSKFSLISVRETSAQEYLKSDLGITSELVVDPVFLHSKQFWSKLANKINFIKPNQYILYYALKGDSILDMECKDLENSTGLPVYIIHPTCRKLARSGKLLINVGPREFLYAIMNARYVVTNSFHATAFSLIYEKDIRFTVIDKKSNRVISMLESFGIEYDMLPNGCYMCENSLLDSKKYTKLLLKSQLFLDNILKN